ncbi:hypothetical protein [Celeribacter naphthalenivorans]|uniref:hypothetical protein n=1 Tax=Celeribacter naphthalenivorans TaxID=1614694 RepID=UPI001CFA0D5A|nr:hypothetical protein [Celeribacter naphthalenivorans]
MKFLLAAPLLISLALPATAQGRFPVEDIAKDLGLTKQELTQCFKANRPSREEMKAAKQRYQAGDAAAPDGARPEMVACVQTHNPEITTARYEEVMRSYAPQN